MVGGWHLAQLNVGRLKAPLDDPQIADFVTALDPINALAEASPGFVWRLQGEGGSATDIRVAGDPLMIVNLTVWESVETLFDFTYCTGHSGILARRRDWFEALGRPHMVLWWLPAGSLPTLGEAMDRLERLLRDGPTEEAFTFKRRFPAPTGGSLAAAG
ncbi:MAG: DUF3291 domain-containing protein [Dongiaceae bacterium]